jgi:hypothetical protein
VQPIIGDAHCFRETWLLYQMLTRLLLTAWTFFVRYGSSPGECIHWVLVVISSREIVVFFSAVSMSNWQVRARNHFFVVSVVFAVFFDVMTEVMPACAWHWWNKCIYSMSPSAVPIKSIIEIILSSNQIIFQVSFNRNLYSAWVKWRNDAMSGAVFWYGDNLQRGTAWNWK